MYIKGYKVSYPVQGICDTSIVHRYFFDVHKAQDFLQKLHEEATSHYVFQHQTMTEVAFIVIEGKHYCVGPPVDIEDSHAAML